jgi:hypothetical protein
LGIEGPTVDRDAGTARPLPRLIKGRTCGPAFITHRRPGPGKAVADRDICPDTGLARLSYGRVLLDAATAVDGPRTGWDLHEIRHSGLTHLGEAGASLLELMAKSRHRKPDNLRRYFKPSPAAMRGITSLLDPTKPGDNSLNRRLRRTSWDFRRLLPNPGSSASQIHLSVLAQTRTVCTW